MIQFIQSATGNTTSSPTTATFPNSVGAAHMIFVNVGISPNTATVSSITDSLGTFYGVVGSSNGTGAASTWQGLGFTPSAGSNTVTVNTTGTPTAIVIDVREYLSVPVSAISSGNYSSYRDPTSFASDTLTGSVNLSTTTLLNGTLLLSYAVNSSTNTYTLGGGGFANMDTATQGALIMACADQVTISPGIYTAQFTQSSSAAHIAQLIGIRGYLGTTMNNYQSPKVGNGISTSERIR